MSIKKDNHHNPAQNTSAPLDPILVCESLKQHLDDFLLKLKQLNDQNLPVGKSDSSINTEYPCLLLALSGGMDSMVLLDLMGWAVSEKLWPSENFHACYIDHQLQPESESWKRFCLEQCDRREISFSSIQVEIEKESRQGMEQLARQARYTALFSRLNQISMGAKGILLTAHHGRDQAETFLLNLMRGAGINGLAAMQEIRRHYDDSYNGDMVVDAAWLARPLLPIAYEQIQAYAESNSLEWVEDPTNQSLAFKRNWVRNQVLPTLQKQFAKVQTTLVQTAGRMQESQFILQRLAGRQLVDLYQQQAEEISSLTAPNGYFLPLPEKLNLDEGLFWPELKNIIQLWGERFGHPKLLSKHLIWLLEMAYQDAEQPETLRENIFSDEFDSTPLKASYRQASYRLPKDARLQLYANRLYFLSVPASSYEMSLEEFYFQNDCFFDKTQAEDQKDVSLKNCLPLYIAKNEMLALEQRNPAIRLCSLSWLKDQKQSENFQLNPRTLKRFFQKNKIPPWERKHWPTVVRQECDHYEMIGILGMETALKNRRVDKVPDVFQDAKAFIETEQIAVVPISLVWRWMGFLTPKQGFENPRSLSD